MRWESLLQIAVDLQYVAGAHAYAAHELVFKPCYLMQEHCSQGRSNLSCHSLGGVQFLRGGIGGNLPERDRAGIKTRLEYAMHGKAGYACGV